MSQIKKINHVAIVVRDIDESLKFWETTLGLKLHHIEVVDGLDIRALGYGDDGGRGTGAEGLGQQPIVALGGRPAKKPPAAGPCKPSAF